MTIEFSCRFSSTVCAVTTSSSTLSCTNGWWENSTTISSSTFAVLIWKILSSGKSSFFKVECRFGIVVFSILIYSNFIGILAWRDISTIRIIWLILPHITQIIKLRKYECPCRCSVQHPETHFVFDLLWKYYEKNGNYRSAAKFLVRLAERHR